MLSRRAKYALRAMIYLAGHRGAAPVSVRDIAQGLKIPQAFLEQIFSELKRANLLVSTRGKQGGFLLSRSPKEINLAEIIRHIDGPLALDNAISQESSSIKGISSPVAGQADILVVPDVEAGNMLAKAITYFAKGRMAGVVVGAQSPLIVASRSDPHDTKLMSIALGVIMASHASSP